MCIAALHMAMSFPPFHKVSIAQQTCPEVRFWAILFSARVGEGVAWLHVVVFDVA